MSTDPKSSYYDAGNIETIEVIRAKLAGSGLDPLSAYFLGNIIKYASRLPFKGDPARDAEKLYTYARWLRTRQLALKEERAILTKDEEKSEGKLTHVYACERDTCPGWSERMVQVTPGNFFCRMCNKKLGDVADEMTLRS